MSCECNVCACSVAPPQSLWYAVTRYMAEYCYLCSDCLGKLPHEGRIATTEQRHFEPTFGPILAEVSPSSGRYQGCGSKMLTPQFFVPFSLVEQTYPERSILVLDLEQYCCPDRFLGWILDATSAGTWAKWPGERWPLYRLLTVRGPFLERFLGLSPDGNPVRPHLSPCECLEPTPEQAKLADDLWRAARAWDAAGRPTRPTDL